ncbi:MAG: hypothetical protein QM710_10350 [Flavobacterium sp.]
MKKAVLHILFLSLLLTTGGAFAFASPSNSKANVPVKANSFKTTASDNNSLLQKSDLLIDIDDYDEYDTDNHSPSIKEKPANAICVFKTAQMLLTNVTAKPSYANNYTHHNFSRLPRYNFISLRVLRI